MTYANKKAENMHLHMFSAYAGLVIKPSVRRGAQA